MPPRKKAVKKTSQQNNGANLGFEATLWKAADKQRSNMDAAEYKQFVPDLLFLKYIPDTFEKLHEKLVAKVNEGGDPEDRVSPLEADNDLKAPIEILI